MADLTPEQREYWEAVERFHEPMIGFRTCAWCNRGTPCPAYVRALHAQGKRAIFIGHDVDDDGNEFYPYWIIGGPCQPIT
jgi:hypothetical protein